MHFCKKIFNCYSVSWLFPFFGNENLSAYTFPFFSFMSFSKHPETYTSGMQSHPSGTGGALDLKICPLKAFLSSPSRALSHLSLPSLLNTSLGDISDISGFQILFVDYMFRCSLHISCSISQHHQSSYFTVPIVFMSLLMVRSNSLLYFTGVKNYTVYIW